MIIVSRPNGKAELAVLGISLCTELRWDIKLIVMRRYTKYLLYEANKINEGMLAQCECV